MRAEPSGVRLTHEDACKVLGMIDRGDRHHDIAAWFGVNQGRIAEVKAGELHPIAKSAAVDQLPPPGPYHSARAAMAAVRALTKAENSLREAHGEIQDVLNRIKAGEL